MQLYFCIVNGQGTETLCTGESITLPFTKFIVKNTAYWNGDDNDRCTKFLSPGERIV